LEDTALRIESEHEEHTGRHGIWCSSGRIILCHLLHVMHI